MNATCERNLEELSAWLDGEASPDESARVESHLKACGECRRSYELLANLGSTVARIQVPLPAVERLRPRRLPQPFWRRLMSWRRPDHPITLLRRKPGYVPGVLPVLGLFGLPVLLLLAVKPEGIAIFLSISGLGLLLGLPLYHFRTEVSLLTSLRRGRCLEEILGTGLPARQLVDTLALQSMSTVVRVGLPLVPLLTVGSQVFEPQNQSMALSGALLWLPAVMLCFWLGSYVVLFLSVWSQDGETRTLPQQALFALVLLPAVGLALLPPYLLWGALWTGLTSRYLAVWGLDHLASVDQVLHRRSRSSRNRWLARSHENPIIARESVRRAASVPGGLTGLVVVRALAVLLPLGWALALLSGIANNDWKGIFWGGVAVFSLLAFARAASRTLGAVVGERERGTWESLVQTSLTRQEFIVGWIWVATRTVALELLPAALLVLAAALHLNAGAGALLALVLLGWMTHAGAYAGLAASAASANQRQANGHLLSLAGYGLLGWLLLAGLGIAALEWMALLGWLDSSNNQWEALIQQVLPAVALAATGALALNWSRRTLARELHFGVARPSRAPASSRAGSALSLVLVSSGCAGLATSLYVVEPLGASPWQALLLRTAAGGSLATLAGLVLHWLCQPLLRALTSRAQGRLRAIALSTSLGGACGLVIAALTLLVPLAAWMGFLPTNWCQLKITRPWGLVNWALAAGSLCGILLGLSAFLQPEEAGEPQPLGGPLRQTLLRVGLSALALTGLGVAFVSPILTYQVNDPALLEEVIGQSRARMAAQGQPARSNPLVQAIASGSPLPAVSELDHYWMGDRRHTLEAAAADPAFFPKRRRAFERQLPLIRSALSGPSLFEVRLDQLTPGPNFLLVRGVARGLAVLALDQAPDEAVASHLLGLRWSSALAGRGTLTQEMVALAAGAVNAGQLLHLLLNEQLSRQSCQEILTITNKLSFSPTSFGQAMDNQLVEHLTYIENLRQGILVEPEVYPLLSLPGVYFDYQARLYANLYLAERPACYQLTEPGDSVFQDLGRNRAAYLVQILVPNVNRAITNYRQFLSRLGAIRLAAALQLYRADHQGYPESLQELVPTYLPELPRNYSGGYDYRREGKAFRLRLAPVDI